MGKPTQAAVGSQEQAGKSRPGRGITVGGTAYKSLTAACIGHGITLGLYLGRLRCGWTKEQALGLEPRYGERCLGRIYLVTQRSTGKKYVGQTMRGSVEMRWQQHVSDARAYGKSLIQKAINAAGKDDFTVVEISRHHSRDELNTAERDAIAKHDTIAPAGFNQTRGGSGWVGNGQPVVWNGRKYKSIATLARTAGLSEFLVRDRLKKGWTLKRAITTPKVTVNAASRPVTVGGVRYESRNHACRAYGIARNVVHMRLNSGWSLLRALTAPVASNGGRVIRVEGVDYPSEIAVCRAYGVDQKVFWHRLNKMRLTPEQAVCACEWPAGVRRPPKFVAQ